MRSTRLWCAALLLARVSADASGLQGWLGGARRAMPGSRSPSSRLARVRARLKLPGLNCSEWLVSEVNARLDKLGSASETWGARFRRLRSSRRQWRRAQDLVESGVVEDLTGSWRVDEKHNMDAFLKGLGFNALQRAAVISAGQVQVIAPRGDVLHIITRDIRGTSELVLPLSGDAVIGEGDGGAEVARRASVVGGLLTITEEALPANGTSERVLSVCERSLTADGRMAIDVRKQTDDGEIVSMRILFSPVRARRPTEEDPAREATADDSEHAHACLVSADADETSSGAEADDYPDANNNPTSSSSSTSSSSES